MGKYIVMDVVFKASSLNYDQGSGNYQELKKITRWNGKQHTFVSRYALRYSLLETGEKMGLWKVDKGEVLTTETGKDNKEGSIQPSTDALLSGKILEYPEFDLFGYLVTSTTPQNFRTAPVKLSHAVSMTPFNYDALFNANIGMANRLRKIHGEMKPNPFTSEEHETYYLYSVVVDVDNVGKTEVYLQVPNVKDKELKKIEIDEEEISDIKYLIIYGLYGKKKEYLKQKKKEQKKEILRVPASVIKESEFFLKRIVLPLNKDSVINENNINLPIKYAPKSKVIILNYILSERSKRERIKNLTYAILKLHRAIKGRDENLSPKLFVLGLYENAPYDTFKDRIFPIDEIAEESIDEIVETTEGNKKIVKVVHKTVKQAKPKFRIYGIKKDTEDLEEDKILKKIGDFLKSPKNEVIVYKLPEIEVEIEKQNKNNKKTENAQ